MQTIDQLNQQFGIPNVATFEAGQSNLARLKLATPAGEAHVYLHGAHVSHYRPAGHEPVLYLSPKSAYENGKPIRGGVPVIFPWFGPAQREGLPMHGIARTRAWEVAEVTHSGHTVRATLALSASPETRAVWDHDFAMRFTVTLGAQLAMELETHNPSDRPFNFEHALHSYFAVGDVTNVTLAGLTGTTFIDKIAGGERRVESENPLRLTGLTDRIYLSSPQRAVIEDPVLRRRILVDKYNGLTTVVWNPWTDKIGTMPDLPAEDWPKFLCVESANAKDNGVELPPNARHTLRVTIAAEKM